MPYTLNCLMMFQKGDEFNTKRNRISTSREKLNTECLRLRSILI